MATDLLIRMLDVTAEIAEGLLGAKDDNLTAPSKDTQQKIIELYELVKQIDTQIEELPKADEKHADLSVDINPDVEEPCYINASDSDSPETKSVEAFEPGIEPEESVAEVEPGADIPEIEPDTVVADVELEKSGANDAADAVETIAADTIGETIYEISSSEQSVIVENVEDEEVADALPSGLTPDDLRRAMSLNDVFLFKRSLFNGSASIMNLALERISLCRNIADVRDLLAKEFSINMKQSEAKAFLSILEPFFDL